MPGTKPARRSLRLEREPRSGRWSAWSVGRASAIAAAECSARYSPGGVAREQADEEIPTGRVQRTARVTSALGASGAKYAGTRARNLVRSKEEAAEALDRSHLEAAERMVDA